MRSPAMLAFALTVSLLALAAPAGAEVVCVAGEAACVGVDRRQEDGLDCWREHNTGARLACFGAFDAGDGCAGEGAGTDARNGVLVGECRGESAACVLLLAEAACASAAPRAYDDAAGHTCVETNPYHPQPYAARECLGLRIVPEPATCAGQPGTALIAEVHSESTGTRKVTLVCVTSPFA